MPIEWTLVLLAVVLGWCVQLVLTYKQSMAFNHEVRTLRRSGTVSVGSGGRRYRGGRAFIAIAVEDRVVRDAISLSGFTTFARAKSVPSLVGMRVNKLKGDIDIPGLSRQQREAARQAATLMGPTNDRARQEVPG